MSHPSGKRIQCPMCEWKPDGGKHWCCNVSEVPSCLDSWDTFSSQGKCPYCKHQWHETQCPICHVWSPHMDWYVDQVKEEVSDRKAEVVEND